MRIFLLLIFLIPIVELFFLIEVGGLIGAVPTILLTIATAVIGIALMRSQGVATIQKAQHELALGQAPQSTMFEGVFIFLGGVLLFFPGLISDSIGLLFLVPVVRRFLISQSMKGAAAKGHFKYQRGEQVFEGEWEEKAPTKPESLTKKD